MANIHHTIRQHRFINPLFIFAVLLPPLLLVLNSYFQLFKMASPFKNVAIFGVSEKLCVIVLFAPLSSRAELFARGFYPPLLTTFSLATTYKDINSTDRLITDINNRPEGTSAQQSSKPSSQTPPST